MTTEEEFYLSCYQELTCLNEAHSVWLVKHVETGELAVKKVIKQYNKTIYERLQQLRIPNVPEILLAIENEHEFILIEEYIHGVSMSKCIERAALDEKETVRIGIAICEILTRLHSEQPPIIHRDIKPANIMRSNDGVVKLIDFNTAREYKPTSAEDTVFMGTEKFAAPEQYGFGQSDARVDIYALGVTLNYLICKSHPREKCVPGALGKIIRKCTRLEPSERYQSAAELAYELCVFQEIGSCEVVTQDAEEIQEMPTTQEPTDVEQSVESTDSPAPKEPTYLRRGWREWLPVGFRSFTPWKMLWAGGVYAFLIYACSHMTYRSDEEMVTGAQLIIYRIISFIMLIGAIQICGNYQNINHRKPDGSFGLMYVGYLAVNLLLFVVCIILSVIIVEVIFF